LWVFSYYFPAPMNPGSIYFGGVDEVSCKWKV
jgi:hypothetical protein